MKTWEVKVCVTTGNDPDANEVLSRIQNLALGEFATATQVNVQLRGRFVVRERRLVRTRRTA